MDQRPRKSLMRNLGEMLGNISAGVFADPANPPARLAQSSTISSPPPTPTPQPTPPPMPVIAGTTVVNQRVQEALLQTPAGPVLLRRTTTDEMLAPPTSLPPPREPPPLAQ